MFRRHKETQRLLKASRKSLKEAEDRAETMTAKKNKAERLIRDISIVLNQEGQGTIVDRYDKIKMLVDDYQSNN